MLTLDSLLDQLYGGQERLSRDEIHRRAVSADLPAETMSLLDALPEGEYAQDEVGAALDQVQGTPPVPDEPGEGLPASLLDDVDLLRELASIHRTRHTTLRHGSSHALGRHTQRMDELEAEYLQRFPDREVDPERERAGARQRADDQNVPR
jgi:hypothetical protein